MTAPLKVWDIRPISLCRTGLPRPYVLPYYRTDWEPVAPSGGRVLGVFWRYPAVLWEPSTPNPIQISWKTLILKKMAHFSCVMWICGGLALCGSSALLAIKKASFGIRCWAAPGSLRCEVVLFQSDKGEDAQA